MEQPGPESPAYLEALGRTIRVLRIDARLERKELAERVGISYSYLSAIENGQRGPSPRLLYALARALGVEDHVLVAAARERLANEAPAAAAPPAPPATAPARAPGALSADNPVLYAPATAAPAAPAAAGPAPKPARRSSVKRELGQLVDRMDDDDAKTVLDIARRLADRPED